MIGLAIIFLVVTLVVAGVGFLWGDSWTEHQQRKEEQVLLILLASAVSLMVIHTW